jgi:hypothetical protein
MSTILQKAGLDPVSASGYGTAIKIVNTAVTVIALLLVERKGRVFLLKIGTGGIVVSLCVLAAIFYSVESKRTDVRAEIAAMVRDGALELDLASLPAAANGQPMQLSVLYTYGDKQAVAEAFTPTPEARQALAAAHAIEAGLSLEQRAALARPADLKRQGQDATAATDAAQKVLAALPPATQAALKNAERIRAAQVVKIARDPGDAQSAGKPLEIVRAHVGPIPSSANGLLTALCIAFFIAFFSVGPGVCVWLALSELMPTRIRSVGMGIALLINQGVGTLIAGAFLPIVGNHGFYAMFLFWAGCTIVYFITAAFFLPETRGKSLEEIERHFSAKH